MTNQHAPHQMLARGASDRSARVRTAAAGNINQTSETLAALAMDPDRRIRQDACENPNAPTSAHVAAALTASTRAISVTSN